MSLAPRLDLRQAQSLVMTPQLQQAIKLLALSNLELEAVVAEELEKNPLLTSGGEEDSEAAPPAAAPVEEAPTDALVRDGDGIADAPLDIDHDGETFHQDSAADRIAAAPEDLAGLDALAGPAPTLHQHLLAQAGERLAGRDLALARRIIDLIDEAGYVAGLDELDAPAGEIARVLAVIQAFDPAGVGARDLAECLAIQAREADRHDPAMAALLAHLDLLARGELPRLRRLCGVDEEDLADMIRELRGYDPRPGLRFGGEAPVPIAPDLFVRRTPAGWAVELNQATLPRLLVDRRYHAELAAGARNKAGKAWLADRLAGANWLVKALDQRARTIVKVASEIVTRQQGFFLHGVGQLKPLTLRTVADAIGMHESTVSRVTSNKYLACDRGLFELKFFFTSGIAAGDGETAAAEAVKSHIARLIAAEGRDILSDDRLVKLLAAQGFAIARRTVAKYREAIGLGSSVQRRRRQALR